MSTIDSIVVSLATVVILVSGVGLYISSRARRILDQQWVLLEPVLRGQSSGEEVQIDRTVYDALSLELSRWTNIQREIIRVNNVLVALMFAAIAYSFFASR